MAANDSSLDWTTHWCAVATSFHERLVALNQLMGRRLRSAEAADAWLHMMERAARSGLLSAGQTELLTRQFLMLAPDHAHAEVLLASLLKDNRPQPVQAGSLVFMITGCHRYLETAQRQLERFRQRGLEAVIVIGDPTLTVADANGSLIRLPVADTYEALTTKVLEGLTCLRRRYGAVAIAKIDDDTQLQPDLDAEVLARLAHAHHYVGNVWRASDRCFHLGKTAQPIPVYARRSPTLFAGGPMYLLGPRAVDHLVREWIFYPDEFAGLIYEDRAIGEGLRRAGIEPFEQSFLKMGVSPKINDRYATAVW